MYYNDNPFSAHDLVAELKKLGPWWAGSRVQGPGFRVEVSGVEHMKPGWVPRCRSLGLFGRGFRVQGLEAGV
jgi:hypothetical protein